MSLPIDRFKALQRAETFAQIGTSLSVIQLPSGAATHHALHCKPAHLSRARLGKGCEWQLLCHWRVQLNIPWNKNEGERKWCPVQIPSAFRFK